MGNDCCLDTDDNSICDSDETKEESVKEPTTIQEKPKNTPPIPPTPIVTKPAYDSEVPTENELKIFL